MKKVYFTLALAALLTAGCSQNEELSVIDPIGNNNALTATFDGVTRTTTTNGSNTQWTAEDIIYVGTSTMNEYKLSSGGGATTGVFTPVSASTEPTGYAVYGASGTPTISETTVTGLSISSTITYNSTKNCENVIMMGKVNTENKTVSFKNAGAILYVKIGTGTSVTSVKAVATYAISGKGSIKWENEVPSYEITDTYGVESHDNITVSGLAPGAAQDVVIPLPPTGNELKKIELYISNSDTPIFSGQIKIERNRYYKIEYNKDGDMIANIEDGLITALNAPTASHVTIVNNVTIAGNDELTPNEKGMELDLNKKTLTIAENKKLVVNLGGTDRQSEDPVFMISNGTIEVNSNSEITCKVNQPCTIKLENCNFTTKGTGTFTINLVIPSETPNGLKDNYNIDTGNYIALIYDGTKINGHSVRYGNNQLFVRTNLEAGGVQIINTSAGEELQDKLILNFKRQSSSN